MNPVIQMRGHNIWFWWELRKIIPQLSSNTPYRELWPKLCPQFYKEINFIENYMYSLAQSQKGAAPKEKNLFK